MSRPVLYILFASILLGNVLLAYQPHLSNPYPLIGDEYVHISFGKYIVEEQELPFTNPYFAVPFKHANFESGFHFLLAGLFAVIPGEPVLFYKYFVIVFSVINSVLVFYLARLLTKSGVAALAAMFFFGSIKSASGFLAHQYFIPLTIGIALLLLLFIYLHRLLVTKDWKYLLYLGGVGVATLLTYPPACLFFIGVTTLYVVSMDHSLSEYFGLSRKKFFAIVASIVAFFTVMFVFAVYGLGLASRIFFPASWDVIGVRLSPVFFFGSIPTSFAVLGLVLVALATKERPKILLYWFLFSLGALYFFYLFNASVLVPFPRLFMFYLVGVSLLAGVGMMIASRFVKAVWGRGYLAVLVVTFIVGVGITQYSFAWISPLTHHEILTPELYTALSFIKESTPENAVIIADSITSLSVYPVSKRHVVNLLDSNVGGGKAWIAHKFLFGACEEKKNSVEGFDYYTTKPGAKRPPLFMLSEAQQKCDFLTPVYDKGPYVYKIGL